MKTKPINVSSVPQRSVFRYPGGKTWLVPQIRRWMTSLDKKPKQFIEAFAGGGIVGLTVAFEQLAEKVILVEIDPDVAAVWKTILGRHADWLACRILDFEICAENVREELAKPRKSVRQRAFCTILRNRTFHGGILANGSSLTKSGENGKGIASRWYPETLANRIAAIQEVSERIEFVQGDGLQVIKENSHSKSTAFFIDPPYTASKKKAGRRLYNHSELDHDKLFSLLAKAKGDCLITYDDDDNVKELAERSGFEYELVAMQSRRLNTMHELLIGKDLTWERESVGDKQRLLFKP